MFNVDKCGHWPLLRCLQPSYPMKQPTTLNNGEVLSQRLQRAGRLALVRSLAPNCLMVLSSSICDTVVLRFSWVRLVSQWQLTNSLMPNAVTSLCSVCVALWYIGWEQKGWAYAVRATGAVPCLWCHSILCMLCEGTEVDVFQWLPAVLECWLSFTVVLLGSAAE